jgi:hypothetical protein
MSRTGACITLTVVTNNIFSLSWMINKNLWFVKVLIERKKERKERKVGCIGRIGILTKTHSLSLSYVPPSNGAVTNEYLSSTIWVRHNRKHYYLYILQKFLIKIRVQLLVFQIYLMMLLCRLQILQYNYHWNLQSIII